MTLLTVSGVVAGYSAADHILKGVDFAIQDRELVCIIGPNGAGKSTLLKTIAGLLTPSAGSIRLRDRTLAGLRPREVTALGIAYVPQEHNVFASMTVRENLEMGGYADRTAPRRLEAVMQRFPVLGRKRRQPARTLSGGERQILAMGMALMVEPAVLLLDEPSAGLSPVAAQQ
jgi:branched-chain amino acid transport system ATP-binding protein